MNFLKQYIFHKSIIKKLTRNINVDHFIETKGPTKLFGTLAKITCMMMLYAIQQTRLRFRLAITVERPNDSRSRKIQIKLVKSISQVQDNNKNRGGFSYQKSLPKTF